jgi:type I restriction enzyme S subunit
MELNNFANWIELNVDDLGKIVTGSTPSKSKSEFYGIEYPFYKPTDLNAGYNTRISIDGLSEQGIQKARFLSENTILVTCIGATIGKVGIIRKAGACNQQINAIIPYYKLLNPNFIYFQTIAPKFQKEIMDNASATNLPILNKSKFEKLLFYICPMPEQQAIVSKIEQLFSDLDNGIENFKKAQEQLKIYRQVVLKNACEGKLVPTEAELARAEGREYEPSDVLLERILEERREKWNGKGKYKEPVAPDTSGLAELPEGWSWTRIDIIILKSQIGLVKSAREQNTENSNIPYIKMNNITMDGKVLLYDLVNVQTTDEELVRYSIQEGDILFNTRNSVELVGKTGIVRGHVKGIVYNNNIMRIRIVNGVSSQFAAYQMCSPDFRNRMEMIKKSTTNVAAIYAKDLVTLSFLLPPFAEQHRIVTEVERRLSVCDKMEETIAESLQKAESLRQSILKKAFEGKLLNEKELEEVRNAPDWEPAEKLFERIKAEKTNTKAKKRGKK